MSDTPSWLHALAGKFVVFEGPDGSGKSTQFKRLAALCAEHGVPVCEVREPGGTAVGERVRAVLLDQALDTMTLRCEMLLYMASRAQLVEERIRPALAAGSLVLADRFVSSTYAYQGFAGGLPAREIDDVARVALQGFGPDLILIFDVDEQTAARRTKGVPKPTKRGRKPHAAPECGGSLFDDRIEQRGDEFQRRVRQGYLQQAAADPARHELIDASREQEEVWAQLLASLNRRMAAGAPGSPR